jgi:biopolymer transport protein ExbB
MLQGNTVLTWAKRTALMLPVVAALLIPSSAAAWWQKDWPYRKQVVVDTSPTGLNLSGAIGRTPILIRLHDGNFSFADVKEDGSDIRFVAADDKTPLAYHIESFDPLLGTANIWVDVPKATGGEKQQVWMYYGNKTAPVAVNTAGTFDVDYTLVYHYGEAVAAPVTDKTAYKNNALNAPAGSNDGAIIGKGGKFNNSPLNVPATPSLAVAAAGPMTFSTWVKEDSAAANAILYARGAGELVIGLANGVPYVNQRGGAGAPTLRSTAALVTGQWSHIGVTADGKNITIYVNGRPAGTAAASLPALNSATLIGGAGFAGELDETRVSKVARSANFMLADANGQGPDSKLITLAQDEKQSGGENIMGYIFAKTPLLEWIIVGICAVMLLIALWVMFAKAKYLGEVEKANKAFLKRYQEIQHDMRSLKGPQGVDAVEQKSLEKGTLYDLYETGIAELNLRTTSYGNKRLSSESIEAMRAAVDAEQVVENQLLDKWMVLLTIAISGGPFIGLLGTVMGVMKTFAGVAMAGDVNVNAIAPGISAALLATVAGLAAAIPALFGYNYLNSKISKASDDMRIFVDRLITRLAEVQAHKAEEPTPPTRLAAE